MSKIISDIVYGDFELDDVLVDLINSNAIQRLKGVHQGGSSYLVNKTWNVTRYQHSIGVMLLVRLLNGSLEEQIAGLLHDVSHTAFSHVIDFALENTKEDYHEEIFDSVIENSDLPNILSKYGYDYKEILENEEKHTILEQKSPKLCADRVDYTLRDMLSYGYTTKDEVDKFLKTLDVVNGEIVINNIESSMWFIDLYYKEVIDFFMHPLNAYGYDKLSKLLKLGIYSKELNMDDILKTDDEVMNILKKSKNNEIQELINSLHYDVNVIVDEANYDIYQKGKVRLIDPTVYINNKLYKTSELDSNVKIINKLSFDKITKGVYVKIL